MVFCSWFEREGTRGAQSRVKGAVHPRAVRFEVLRGLEHALPGVAVDLLSHHRSVSPVR